MILDRDYKKLEGKMNIDTVGQLKKKKRLTYKIIIIMDNLSVLKNRTVTSDDILSGEK